MKYTKTGVKLVNCNIAFRNYNIFQKKISCDDFIIVQIDKRKTRTMKNMIFLKRKTKTFTIKPVLRQISQ